MRFFDRKSDLEMHIIFNSFKNYCKDPQSTLKDLKSSFKFKVSKRIIKELSGKELEIKVLQTKSIEFIISFPRNLSTHHEELIADVPDEGPIVLPYSQIHCQTHTKGLVDILIVDDIELNLTILAKIIKSLETSCKCSRMHRKFEVHSAKSGKEALYLISQLEECGSGYRLVLMDCFMPELDGWETSKLINRMFKQKEIQVLPYIIAYSAFDSSDDAKKCEEAGMCGRISKPCYHEHLCQEIHKWVSNPVRISRKG